MCRKEHSICYALLLLPFQLPFIVITTLYVTSYLHCDISFQFFSLPLHEQNLYSLRNSICMFQAQTWINLLSMLLYACVHTNMCLHKHIHVKTCLYTVYTHAHVYVDNIHIYACRYLIKNMKWNLSS